jgi:hypothetical protein
MVWVGPMLFWEMQLAFLLREVEKNVGGEKKERYSVVNPNTILYGDR